MIKKVLIIINITKDDSMNLAREISIWLKDKSIDCEFISFDGFCDNSPVIGYDLVITLGGDGTVLWAARNCLEADIPVFPVNLGQLLQYQLHLILHLMLLLNLKTGKKHLQLC